MNSVLRSIISSTWAISEEAAIGYMPLVEKILSGATVDLSGLKSKEEVGGISSSINDKVIAILPIKDVITKNDFCGAMGTVSMDRKLKEFYADETIGAIILDIDTPGGETSYLENFKNTIASAPKPVFAYISGYCCSAGYYLASNCSQIFASSNSDLFGSIGTMISLRGNNPKAKIESSTIIHTIYATKSTDKNKAQEEALKGNYDLIRSNILDPLNELFHEAVLQGRPEVNKEVLSGSVYFTQEAIKNNLIDGVKSFEQLCEDIFSSMNQNPNNMLSKFFKPKNNMSKPNLKVSAILGREIKSLADLKAEDLAVIESSLSEDNEKEGNEVQPVSEERITEIVTSTVAKSLESVISSIQSLTEKVNGIENAEATPPAGTTPTTGASSTSPVAEWDSPEFSFNK